VAGAQGVDVGGDWFSIMQLDNTHFGFVVGDVSGRGIDAASHMARVRFTLRAYLIEGHLPHVALDLCLRQLNIATDGHLPPSSSASVILRLRRSPSPKPVTSIHFCYRSRPFRSSSRRVGPPLGVVDVAYEPVTIDFDRA